MQRLILCITLPIAVHTSLTLKSNIFLYRSTEFHVLAIAQKYMVFSMGTSTDKAGYISDILVWFDSINVLCSQQKKKKKKSKPKDQHWLCLNFHVVFSFVCKKMLAPLQHEVSMHLHSFKFYIKRQPPPPPFFLIRLHFI